MLAENGTRSEDDPGRPIRQVSGARSQERQGVCTDGREHEIMRKNACGLDRTVRLIAGLALAVIALGTSGGLADRDENLAPWQILAAFAAAELLVTGLLQWCPGSYLLGVDTCASER